MLQSEDVWPAMTMGSDDLRLELVSGNSDQPIVRLRPGEPMDPLSMGRLGYWRILARGVADVHAFVYFDGEGVFVASADPSQPAYINRTPVGGEWTEILPPCEIRFGEAVISFRGRAPSQLAVSHGASQGGNWQAVAEMDFDDVTATGPRPEGRPQRIQKPQIDLPEDDAEPTRVAPDGSQPAQRKRRRKPKIRVPSPEEATLIRPLDELESSNWNAPAAAPAQQWAPPAQYPPDARPLTPPPGVAPYQQQVQLIGQPIQPMPAPPPGVAPMAAPMSPGFVPPGVGPQPGWAPGPVPPPQSAIETQLVKAQSPSRLPPALLPYVNKAVEAWKGSSVPQKLILVLLPLAFAAIFVVFTDEEPKRTGTKPKGSASAAVIASAPPTASSPLTASAVPVSPPTASVAAAQTTAPPASTSKPAGTSTGKAPPKTIERQAADAVIAGSYNEAIKLYEQLANEHPDQPVYKESIRILRAKLAETH